MYNGTHLVVESFYSYLSWLTNIWWRTFFLLNHMLNENKFSQNSTIEQRKQRNKFEKEKYFYHFQHVGNSYDLVSCMLYWIHLVVCEHLMLCYIVYFVLQMCFFFLAFKQYYNTKPIHFFKPNEKTCISVSDLYMQIVNNKHTLL